MAKIGKAVKRKQKGEKKKGKEKKNYQWQDRTHKVNYRAIGRRLEIRLVYTSRHTPLMNLVALFVNYIPPHA